MEKMRWSENEVLIRMVESLVDTVRDGRLTRFSLERVKWNFGLQPCTDLQSLMQEYQALRDTYRGLRPIWNERNDMLFNWRVTMSRTYVVYTAMLDELLELILHRTSIVKRTIEIQMLI